MGRKTFRQQAGATLIICLIVLVVASSLAVFGSRTAQNDMRLSADQQDRAIALQRAENALRLAEERLEGFTTYLPIIDTFHATQANGNDAVNGFIRSSLNENTRNAENWWTNQTNWDSFRFPVDSDSVSQISMYTIEEMGSFAPPKGTGASSGYPQHVYVFRIVGKGVGPGGSEVFLRSTYNLMRSI